MEKLKKMANPYDRLVDEVSGLRKELCKSQEVIAGLLSKICDYKQAQKESDNTKHRVIIRVSRLALIIAVLNVVLYFNIDTINSIKGLW